MSRTARPLDGVSAADPVSAQGEHPERLVPERGVSPGDLAAQPRASRARFEPVIGRDDDHGLFSAVRHVVADDPVLEDVRLDHHVLVFFVVLRVDPVESRRSVRHEEMPHRVAPLEVHREKIRAVRGEEVLRDLVVRPDRRVEHDEVVDRVLRIERKDLVLFELGPVDVENAAEILVGDVPALHRETGDLFGARDRRHAPRGQTLAFPGIRVREVPHSIGDHHAVDLLGGVRGEPADDVDLPAVVAEEIPHGVGLTVHARDGDFFPRLGIDHREVEDAVVFGEPPRRDRCPDERR